MANVGVLARPLHGQTALAQTPAPAPPPGDTIDEALTDLIGSHQSGGSSEQMNAALPAIYEQLREIAASYLKRERPNHTLQATALVHESYLRLVSQHSVNWNNRLQFISVAARMMRRILSNYATARKASKRDSGAPLLELDAALEMAKCADLNVARLEQALGELETLDARQARVVELRFYGGLTIDETAEVLGISSATVQREWVSARQWLHREVAAA